MSADNLVRVPLICQLCKGLQFCISQVMSRLLQHLDYTQNPGPEIPNLEPDASPPLFSLTKPFIYDNIHP